MAARTQTLTQSRRSNPRAALAILCGLVATITIPAAIELTRKVTGADLLDAAWAIPLAAIAALASLLFERGARGLLGSRRLIAARVFAVTGICLVLSSSLAVGIYEFLLWNENR